mmetsp:Transcript_19941/g.29846  ORF Transcript_19941/g.29846 Transcript_19941/m.29846 type:complete len:131 (-) Transcript_19941:51-443(-)
MHMSLSTRNKFKVQCLACRAMFEPWYMKTHVLVHTNDRPFDCLSCNKSFRSRSLLSRHINNVHARLYKYHCPQCSKNFTDPSNLKKHVSFHSERQVWFGCTMCIRRFESQEALKRHHKRSHSHYMVSPSR